VGASAAAQLQYPLPPGCTARFVRPGDEEAILHLLERAFGGWPKKDLLVPPIEHLRWKLSSHEKALWLHTVAELDGRIIACRPFLARYLKLDNQVVLARTAVDRATLPEFQRQNIMNAMEVRLPHEWVEKFDVILSLRNNWQSVHANPGANNRRTIDVVTRKLDGSLPRDESVDWSLRRVAAFDERIDAFWRQASRPYRVAIARTMSYLNYRYADQRAGNYTIVLAERDDLILGYIITTAWQGTGHIADALVLPERLDVLESLLVDAVARARAVGNTSLECWRFPYHPYVPVSEKVGFDKPRRTHGLNLQSLHGQDNDVAFFADPRERAHFSAGDTDLV
jgi:hypothetical protein